jgi:NTE family protein
MPFGSEGLQAGIGLTLSGGGFRATLFHAEAPLRLNQLGYLGRLEIRRASSSTPPTWRPASISDSPSRFLAQTSSKISATAERLLLTDGGVYDNLGLETVQKRLKTLLVSDAGAPFDYGGVQGKDWPRETLRVINVLSHQAWNLRTTLLIRMYQGNEREGVYWGIGTPISRYKLPDALSVPPEVTERLAKIRTRLNAFNDEEQCMLINWGYAVCDGAVRKYTRPPKSTVPQWPYPNYPLSQGVPAGVKANDTPDLVQPVPQPKEPPQLPVARA